MARNRVHTPGTANLATPLLNDETESTTIDQSHDEEERVAPPQSVLQRLLPMMLSPFTDEKDSLQSIAWGLLTMVVSGSILGLVMPKNDSLPSAAYRTLSSMIGYTCFVMWSVSFYPQVINNFRRRTTLGLSADFCGLNVLGFGCYAVYNVAMFYSSAVRREYKERYGEDAEITVQSNDVAFAVHSFILASITLLQIAYYDGLRSQQRPSRVIQCVIAIILVVIAAFPLIKATGIAVGSWLDYLYILSFVKILVTLIKYIPQVILNIRRKSTAGFSIWQILLDLSGGVLNDLQLVLDSADLQDWSGITGNPAKLCLGVVSILFDLVFITQHYVLYRRSPAASVETQPLTSPPEEDQQSAPGGNASEGDPPEIVAV